MLRSRDITLNKHSLQAIIPFGITKFESIINRGSLYYNNTAKTRDLYTKYTPKLVKIDYGWNIKCFCNLFEHCELLKELR